MSTPPHDLFTRQRPASQQAAGGFGMGDAPCTKGARWKDGVAGGRGRRRDQDREEASGGPCGWSRAPIRGSGRHGSKGSEENKGRKPEGPRGWLQSREGRVAGEGRADGLRVPGSPGVPRQTVPPRSRDGDSGTGESVQENTRLWKQCWGQMTGHQAGMPVRRLTVHGTAEGGLAQPGAVRLGRILGTPRQAA